MEKQNKEFEANLKRLRVAWEGNGCKSFGESDRHKKNRQLISYRWRELYSALDDLFPKKDV